MIACLEPLFPGEWLAHAEGVALAPPGAAEPTVAAWLDRPGALATALQAHARQLDPPVDGAQAPLAALASVWSLTYFWRLLPPVVAATSVLQRALPVAAAQARVAMGEDGVPRPFLLAHDGQAMPGTPAAARYGALLHEHIAPLAARLARDTGLAPRIVWGNAARYLEFIFAEFRRLMPAHEGLRADHAWLLTRADWAGLENPMYRPARVVTRGGAQDGATYTLLRRCCLYYQLPGHDYCDLCPLAPCNRAARRLPDPGNDARASADATAG
ncbi:siderophore-iron reductase FhuF [Achromobacter xylosoxidans]|uniref:siderophore-iron reductase FhuF n=1 Tax=Alcaligenes xylosoxydans xylosoxydans TaxID=85698 RepID=UPI00203D4C1C|nr:siderophore-iron reductase FhuF [Achromobacter xylosoxidans]MCM2572373.1 siderophore-iron reductase FhuF [Achromobacter xylosoxidans]